MHKFIKTILEVLNVYNIPFKVVVSLFIVSGILVLAPTSFIVDLGLDGFLSKHDIYVGVFFLGSGALVAVTALGWGFKRLREKMAYRKWKDNLGDALGDLDHAEKAILREFYLQGKHTIKLPLDEPTVVGLSEKGIIRFVGELGYASRAGLLFPCRVAGEARRLLTPEMLDLPTGDCTDEERQRLRNSRPCFVRERGYYGPF